MRKNKKAAIIALVSVVTVLVVGVIATTYAWFLSRYANDYDFVLNSESLAIIKYETDLAFASGDITTTGNALVPATAKTLVGISQEDLSPLDVFDDAKVNSTAHAVAFTATGAYWTGSGAVTGGLIPELHVYLSSYAEQQNLTEENVVTLLRAEENALSHPLTDHDLVGQGEIGFYVVIEYLGHTFLYYDGAYYIHDATVLPADEVDFDDLGLNGELHWRTLTALETMDYNYNTIEVTDNPSYLFLQPNTTFSFTLYAFVAKTDEELDPAINGERITLFATLRDALGTEPSV